ncbi:hypothetical protein EZZ80_07545 [Pseudomonas putida]|nr:hypothetical protein DM483_25375 [Pseudomonas sp. SMT-1]QDW57137.1 hypothetical protein FFH79_009770 [Pseudomonas sp. KBS0802]UZA73359.1 hypothetical protein EZZ80_07545 [Pseudomonas putida]
MIRHSRWTWSFCGSGLVSRSGREAAPRCLYRGKDCWGRCAARSRHKAAPTGAASAVQAVTRFNWPHGRGYADPASSSGTACRYPVPPFRCSFPPGR